MNSCLNDFLATFDLQNATNDNRENFMFTEYTYINYMQITFTN